MAVAGVGGRSGELVFNGYRISVGEEILERRCWSWLYNNMNVLNATELYTKK